MPDPITIAHTSLEIDDIGKNIYINNEDDYNSFVYLCNNFTFDNNHKKVFHITKDLSFDNSNQPDPINNFYHVLDGHGFKISGIVPESISMDEIVEDEEESSEERTYLNYGLIINNNYGTVRNITLEACVLSLESEISLENDNDKYGIGLIVGKNHPSGVIKRCKTLGGYTNTNNEIISPCTLTGNTAHAYGGICGVNNSGIIDSCVNGANITCTSDMIVGGIVGASGNFNNEATRPGTISNSYNISIFLFAASPEIFGGVVGLLSHTEEIKNCIQFGYISIVNVNIAYAGHIIGKIENILNESLTSDQLNVSYCYYFTQNAYENIGIGNPEINDSNTTVSNKIEDGMNNVNNMNASYDFENTWVMSDMFKNCYRVTETGRPMLLYEISISGYKDDTDWFDPKIYKHQIKTASQIASLKSIINMDEVKNASKVHVFEQTRDISFNGKLFTHPIGTKEVPFKEIYNGNGYKISGFIIGGYIPINTNLNNISNERACSIFGYNYGIIENIWIYNCKINPDNSSSTTIVDINNGNILNCKISNSTIYNKLYRIGGLCNLNDTNGYISNCLNDIGDSETTFGNVNNPDIDLYENFDEYASSVLNYIGGICAINRGKIYNSMNKCTIRSKSDGIGGICGLNYGTISGCNEPRYFYDLDNYATSEYEENIFTKQEELYSYNIYTIGKHAGGICGTNYGKINLCSNYYEYITASANAGGICGMNYFQYSSSTSSYIESGTISECKNGNPAIDEKCGGVEPYYDEDEPDATRTNFGGICGLSFNSVIRNCYNMAKLFDSNSNARCVGGIVGKFTGIMENCYNTGEKPDSTDNFCGGLIGYIERYSTTNENQDTMLSNVRNSFNSSLNGTYSVGGKYDTSTAFDITDSALTVQDSDLKDDTTFTGWDFDLIWEMDIYNSETNANYEYPRIKLTYERQMDNIVPKMNNYQSLGIHNKKFRSIHAREVYADKLNANVNFGKLYIESTDCIVLDGGTPSDLV